MTQASLSDLCRHCGLPLSEHLHSIEGVLHLRPCLDSIRAKYPGVVAEYATRDGICLVCGSGIVEHFRFESVTVTVLGSPLPVRLAGVPVLFAGSFQPCTEADQSATDSSPDWDAV